MTPTLNERMDEYDSLLGSLEGAYIRNSDARLLASKAYLLRSVIIHTQLYLGVSEESCDRFFLQLDNSQNLLRQHQTPGVLEVIEILSKYKRDIRIFLDKGIDVLAATISSRYA